MRTQIVRRNVSDVTLLEVNARYMRSETYNALVANIRRDGALTSVPLLAVDPRTGLETVVSGNHRTMAARDAGLTEAEFMLILDPIDVQEFIAKQLSHNAIEGEDDAATLKALYDSLDDVDWRNYSGLDDKSLQLMAQVDVSGLSEANLDFSTVQLVFLPHEFARAEESLAEARRTVRPDSMWLARDAQHTRTLDALAAAHAAWNVGTVSIALEAILDVFEAHLTDLQDGYLDGEGEAFRSGRAPIESVLGTRTIPTEVASVVERAMRKAIKSGVVTESTRWRLLQVLAQQYLTD